MRTAYAKSQRKNAACLREVHAVVYGWSVGYEMGGGWARKDEGLTDQSMECRTYPVQELRETERKLSEVTRSAL